MSKFEQIISEIQRDGILTQLARVICLFAFGIAFDNILQAAFKDYHNLWFTSSKEYAGYGSWLIATGIIFIIISWYYQRELLKYREYPQSFIRKSILNSFLFICCFTSVFFITDIIKYLITDSFNIIEIANSIINLSIISVGILFARIESKYFNMTMSKKYFYIVSILLIGFMSAGLFVIKYFTSSKNYKQTQIEYLALSNIDRCSDKITENYKIFNNIPTDKDQLIKLNLLPSSSIISYTPTSTSSFKMCTSIESNEFRIKKIVQCRNFIKPSLMKVHKGMNCWQFSIQKADQTHPNLDMKHLDNDNDKLKH